MAGSDAPGAQGGADHVDLEQPAVVVGRGAVEGRGVLDPGVVDQDVDRAEGFGRRGEGGVDLALVGDVAGVDAGVLAAVPTVA